MLMSTLKTGLVWLVLVGLFGGVGLLIGATQATEPAPMEPTNPLHFQLSGDMSRQGWTLRVLAKTESLAPYKGYFGFEPELVLLMENRKVGTDGKHPWLSVVAYPTERIQDRLKGQTGLFEPRKDSKLPALELFWQTRSHVFLASQGEYSAEQRKLAAVIRASFVGVPTFDGKAVPIDYP